MAMASHAHPMRSGVLLAGIWRETYHQPRNAEIAASGRPTTARLRGGIFITDAAVLELAKGLLVIALWSSVPFGMATVFSGAMRAGGVAFAPMLLSIFAIAAIEVPAAVILSRTIGLEGVWAAYPIVFCAMFVLQLGYYMLVWRRRPLRRLV